ncbi:hypothetical protein GCM10009864_28810 [Streptomyces lunalinharesii]|uniref:ATP-binding protein n=1 Tax=Streptomyces lunalinharesii TaxID=333384 RepID=A0ABN3RSZ9_9ACTN
MGCVPRGWPRTLPRLTSGDPQTIGGTVAVEVKIGVQHAPREIVLESGQPAEEVERAVSDALTGKAELLSLVDDHGRRVLVAASRVAYVELGEPTARKVGFGAP